MTKNLKEIFIYFLDQKLQFTFPWASIQEAQATGEAFRPQKRTSRTTKREISLLFSIFVGHFVLLDANPDPATQINVDPDPKSC